MKIVAVTLLLTSMALGALTASAQAPSAPQAEPVKTELTLDDVIEVALARNAGLRAAEREADAADRGHAAARGRLWPFLDGFADYQYSGPDQGNATRLLANIGRMPQLAPDLSGNRPIPGFPFGTREFDQNLFAGGVRLSYPLYVGGRIVAEIEASRLLTMLARERVTLTADELIFNLSSTFYNLLRFEANVKATEANLKALEEARKNIEEQVSVGRLPRVDLLKVNTRLAAVRQELVRARNEVDLAYALLKTLMGLDVTEPLKVKGALAFTPQILALPEDLAEADLRHPELQARRRAVEVQAQQVRIAQGARLPSLHARAQYAVGTGFEQFDPDFHDVTAGLTLSIPIFTGGQLSQRVAQEEARLARAREEYEKARLDVHLGVQDAHLKIDEASERVRVAEAALEEAREVLRIEGLKVELGRGVIEDLLDAQAAELQAETNYTRALADYNTALVGRQKAIGRIRPLRP